MRNAPIIQRRSRSASTRRRCGLLAAAAASTWLAAGFRPFTWPMRIAVIVPVVAVLAASWGRARDRGARGHDQRPGLAVWAGLLAALVTWELIAFVSSPREEHPTLSSIADEIMSVRAGRALMFAAWLGAAWWLFLAPNQQADR